MVRLAGVTLGELITQLIDLDLEDPAAHDSPVSVEQNPDTGDFWLVVGQTD